MDDPRWGNYVPWFFRSTELCHGDYHLFLMRIAHRLRQLFLHNYHEAQIQDLDHFGDRIESQTFQRFKYKYEHPSTLDNQIEAYFDPLTLENQAAGGLYGNKPVSLLDLPRSGKSNPEREGRFRKLVSERLGVLEAICQILPDSNGGRKAMLIRDIRRYFAEAGIMMDMTGDPPLIVPIDEALLQREIIDRLLPTLEGRFPQIAKDLIAAYHELRDGKDTNFVFGDAFKALETLAKALNGLMLNKLDQVQKFFPQLHPTTRKTIVNIADHRGDEGGHGGKGPIQQEMRYLLFEICNIALLMLECYPPAPESSSLH